MFYNPKAHLQFNQELQCMAGKCKYLRSFLWIGVISAFNCFSRQFVVHHRWCIMTLKWMSIKKSAEKDELKDKFWCLFNSELTSEFYGMTSRRFLRYLMYTLSFKVLERFSCCFSIVWTQLQYRNIINSLFANRLYFSKFLQYFALFHRQQF